LTLQTGLSGDEALMPNWRQHVGAEIGPIARPDEIVQRMPCPRPASGKIHAAAFPSGP